MKRILILVAWAVVVFLIARAVIGFLTPDTWMATYYPDNQNLLVSESTHDVGSLEECRAWVEVKASMDGSPDYDYECGKNCHPWNEDLGIIEPYVCEETVQ